VVYEDDDEADLNEKEMQRARELYLDGGHLGDDGGDDGESDISNNTVDCSSSDDEYDPFEWIIPLFSLLIVLT